MTATNGDRQMMRSDADRARVFLTMVGDKWPLLVACHLKEGSRRFTELKQAVEGISQRMLTVTLRSLERDGLVARTVHGGMPPHVRYQLTPMGRRLSEVAAPLLEWTMRHLTNIDEARAAYDTLTGGPSTTNRTSE